MTARAWQDRYVLVHGLSSPRPVVHRWRTQRASWTWREPGTCCGVPTVRAGLVFALAVHVEQLPKCRRCWPEARRRATTAVDSRLKASSDVADNTGGPPIARGLDAHAQTALTNPAGVARADNAGGQACRPTTTTKVVR